MRKDENKQHQQKSCQVVQPNTPGMGGNSRGTFVVGRPGGVRGDYAGRNKRQQKAGLAEAIPRVRPRVMESTHIYPNLFLIHPILL